MKKRDFSSFCPEVHTLFCIFNFFFFNTKIVILFVSQFFFKYNSVGIDLQINTKSQSNFFFIVL